MATGTKLRNCTEVTCGSVLQGKVFGDKGILSQSLIFGAREVHS